MWHKSNFAEIINNSNKCICCPLVVGGWTQEDPSCLVEQFCSEYNEWRTAARMLKNRGAVAVGTLSGQIYAVGGEDSIRCYNSVERWVDTAVHVVFPVRFSSEVTCLAKPIFLAFHL